MAQGGVFSHAIGVLFNNPAIGEDADWYPAGVIEAVPVRVIRRRPDEVFDTRGSRIWRETLTIDLEVLQAPALAAGDEFVIACKPYVVQGEPVRDTEGLVWSVDLRPR